MIPECNKEGLKLLECFYLVIFRLRRHHMFDVASVGMDQHRWSPKVTQREKTFNNRRDIDLRLYQ